MPVTLTAVEEAETVEQLCKLLATQILVRCVISRSKAREYDPFEFCRIEVVSASEGNFGTARMGGFVHFVFHTGRTEDHSHPMHAHPMEFREIVSMPTTLDQWIRPKVADVVKYWRMNITGDGPRPYREWLEGKPFSGVLSLGGGSSMTTDTLNSDARPLLIYYGTLLSEFQAHVAGVRQAVRQFGLRGHDEEIPLLERTHDRLRAFVFQIQETQIRRIAA